MANKKDKKQPIFDIKSKQIKDTTKKSGSETTDQKAAAKELESIRAANDVNMGSIVKLSGSLRKTLDTGRLAIPEAGVQGKDRVDVKDSNMFSIVGKFKSKEEADAIIGASIEESVSRITPYSHTGVYAKMLEARRNNYLEENLPVLRTSLEMFVSDVNNGSFRGSDYGNHNKFRFYENGSIVTDKNKIEKMTEYLNPTTYNKLKDDVKTFNEIDATGDYLAYKHGNSDTRLISHKDVAKDMYIKYVLKEAKKGVTGLNITKEKVMLPASESALESINDFITTAYKLDAVGMNDDLSKKLPKEILNQLPNEFYTSKEIFKCMNGNESYEVDKNTYHECQIKETFLEFAERYLFGKTAKIYNINTKPDRETKIGGYSFTFEGQGFSNNVAQAIMSEIENNFALTTDIISNESVELGMESFINTDAPLVTKMLNEVSFDAIYNTSFDRIMSYNKPTINSNTPFGMETYNKIPDNKMLRAKGGTTADRLYVRCFNVLNKNNTIGMEYTQSPDTTLNASYGIKELGGTLLDEKNYGAKKAENAKAVEKVKTTRTNYNRLEKMFRGIKGCTAEFLENDRKIDLVAGGKNLGCFYIEYTHQDIQHYIGLRTILGNPVSYTQNIDIMDTNPDEEEETLSRLIFSDTIKPLLEQNIDTKFIRNNSDILYSLQKLMEENEVSYSMTYNDLTRYSMYNLSRVIFIPASQIIFKRNGDTPLGESRFTQAVVPATSFILAREAYLSYILCDAKSYSFLTVPRGMSELGGEMGQDHLMDKINDMVISRAKLRDIAFNNAPLTHRFIVMEKGEDAEQDIDIKSIDFPDFQINEDQMRQWLNEATSIVGVSAALFDNSNNEVELMHKLSIINDKDMIRVLKCRQQKKIPSSQLATRLLQLRGGEEFNNIQVEWVEPSINVYNHSGRSEILEQLSGIVEKYLGIYDMVHENDDEYKNYRPLVVSEILSKLTDSDNIILSMEDIIKEARQKFLVELTEEVEEKKIDKQNDKNKEDNQDENNEYNPDNVEGELDDNNVDNNENPFA